MMKDKQVKGRNEKGESSKDKDIDFKNTKRKVKKLLKKSGRLPYYSLVSFPSLLRQKETSEII